MIHPTRFNSIIGLTPPSAEPPQLFWYRLLFQHDNHGGAHYWRGSPNSILLNWLRAVIPPLHAIGHGITLTHSPHEIFQHDTQVSVSFLPPPDDLHQYVYNPTAEHSLTHG